MNRRPVLASSGGRDGCDHGLRRTVLAQAQCQRAITLGVMGLNGRGRALAKVLAAQPDVAIAYLCDVDERVIGPAEEAISPARITRRKPSAISAASWMTAASMAWRSPRRTIGTPWPRFTAAWPASMCWWKNPARTMSSKGSGWSPRRASTTAWSRSTRSAARARRCRLWLPFCNQGASASCISLAVGSRRAARTSVTPWTRLRPRVSTTTYGWRRAAAGVQPNHFHYRWHWFWEYGTGELGNNGVHGLDLARWGLGVDMPSTVVSSGAKQYFDDDQVTPDTQVVCYEYPGLTLLWEHRTWSQFGINDSTFGVEFHGADGVVTTDGRTWWIHRPKEPKKAGYDGDTTYEPQHRATGSDAIRGNGQLTADIEVGHIQHVAVPHRQHLAARGAQAGLGRRGLALSTGRRRCQRPAGREYRAPWTLPDV